MILGQVVVYRMTPKEIRIGNSLNVVCGNISRYNELTMIIPKWDPYS
jgi:hypothetical protein